MALTKSRTSLYASQTLTAGAGDTTSSAVDISASYATVLDISLVNGTAPTVPAQVRVQVACDTIGTLWVDYFTFVAGTTASATYYASVEFPQAIQAFRTIAGSNTTNNVTLNADYSKVTAL